MWARLDDNFDSHPKVIALWEASPAAVGLYARALSYSARHLTDGEVPNAFVAQRFRSRRAHDQAVQSLVAVGLWETVVHGWRIHDFLDLNRSRAEYLEDREQERAKKQRQRSSRKSRSRSVSPRDTGYGRDLQLSLLEPDELAARERARSLEVLAALEAAG